MKKNVYSIYDAAATVYSLPFFYDLDTQAMRAFEAASMAKDSHVSLFPQDFALYKLGEFNQDTGLLEPLQEPMRICGAVDILRDKQIPDDAQMDIEEQSTLHADNYTS